MTVTNIIEGLLIIQKSKPNNESDYHFRAEHDVIFVSSLDWEISDEDKAKLEMLDWMEDEYANGWIAII